MIVVSDTSPIINLAAIGRLHILADLYGTIVIPEAVYHEVVTAGAGLLGAEQVRTSDWIESRPVADRTLVTSLQLELDLGEAESIVLALASSADLLLMDERRGRRAASNLGIPVLGLLGVLILAKRHGLIENLKPVLDGLIVSAGFYVGEDLYARVLEAAGE